MDMFANYPHIESLFVRLGHYNVQIEEMHIGFRGVGGGWRYPQPTSLDRTPNREYGDPLDESNGWTLTALIFISWPKSRPHAPLLPDTWRLSSDSADKLYKRHTGFCASPHPFIVKAYSHKDGLEALYLLLVSLLEDLETFDAKYCLAR